MTLNDTDFRHCLSSFTTGVTIATTLDNANQPCGITINSFGSVSLHPPLVLFCLDNNASCFDQFLSAPQFAINILSEDQEDLSHRFAHFSEDRWEKTDFISGKNLSPLLSGCVSHLECDTYARHVAGDHTIIIGKVTAVNVSEKHTRPLLYYKSNYSTLPKDYA